MKKIIYVIQEADNNNFSVIGVADDLAIVDQMLSDYYEEFTVIKETGAIPKLFISDSDIIWSKDIEIPFKRSSIKLSVWLERFVLNEV